MFSPLPMGLINYYEVSGLKQHKLSYRSGGQDGSPWTKIEMYSGLCLYLPRFRLPAFLGW